MNRGIILTVGFLPGLKANIIPLLFEKKVGEKKGVSFTASIDFFSF